MRRIQPGGGGTQGASVLGGLLVLGLFASSALATPLSDGAALVVLLDRSFSMEQSELWQAAREEADTLFSSLPAGHTAGLVVFDTEAQVVVPLTPEVVRLKRALWDGLATRGQGTRPQKGLEGALHLLKGRHAATGGGVIHLISDFQRTAFEAWRPHLPAAVGLVLHSVPEVSLANQSILWAAVSRSPEHPGHHRENGRESKGDARHPPQRPGSLYLRLAAETFLPAVPILAGTLGKVGVFRIPPAGRRPEMRLVITPLRKGYRGVVVQRVPADGWPSDDRIFAVLGRSPAQQSHPGLSVRLERALPGRPCTVLDPSGIRHEVFAQPGSRGALFRGANEPGIYQMECADWLDYLVVNPEPLEGDLSRWPLSRLRGRYSVADRSR